MGPFCIHFPYFFFLLGVFLVSFILAMEMVGPEKRVYCGIAIEIYFVLVKIKFNNHRSSNDIK